MEYRSPLDDLRKAALFLCPQAVRAVRLRRTGHPLSVQKAVLHRQGGKSSDKDFFCGKGSHPAAVP